MAKSNKVDQQIRCAQTIGQLTEKMIDIAKTQSGIDKILKEHKNESIRA